jgi:DNA-binding TFAR19-related protein (PDSD5 family)
MGGSTYIPSNPNSEIEKWKKMKAKEAKEKYLPKLCSIRKNLGEALEEELQKLKQSGAKSIKAYYYPAKLKFILREVTELIDTLNQYNDDLEVDESEIEMKIETIYGEIADLPLISYK